MIKGELLQKSNADFELIGVINHNTVPIIWNQRQLLNIKEEKLNIDLSKISHSDSSGVALLACLQKETLDRQQILQFTNIPQQLQQIIQLSHLEDILNTQQAL